MSSEAPDQPRLSILQVGGFERRRRGAPTDLQRRLSKAFRHTLGRIPDPSEIELLRKTYEEQHLNFHNDPKAAEAFLKVGELKLPPDADPVDFAAMTATASVLLNLNETITK